jgi:hypothetical protein
MKIVRFSLVPCRSVVRLTMFLRQVYIYIRICPQYSQKQHFDKMIPGKQNARFVEIAESLKPQLQTRVEHALRVVKVERDETSLMGWKAVDAGRVEDVGALNGGDQVIYDFGKSVQYVLAGEEGVVPSGSLIKCYSMSL